MKRLQAGELDAFVHDKPLLSWLVLQDFSAKLRVLDIVLQQEHYAIALPKVKRQPAADEVINVPLLEETESDWWDRPQRGVAGRLGKKQPD